MSGPDTPFVVGSVVGSRAFEISPDGWLRGITFPEVWGPEENEAHCYRAEPVSPALPSFASFYMGLGVHGWEFPMVPGPASLFAEGWESLACEVAGSMDCRCGFYAYFRNYAGPYNQPHRATAIISGYGRVTLGSRGFRAQKARLLALVKPSTVWRIERERADLMDQIIDLEVTIHRLRRERRSSPRRRILWGYLLVALGISVARPQPVLFTVGSLTALLTFAAFTEILERRTLAVLLDAASLLLADLESQTKTRRDLEIRWLKVLERYPGIPVFDTFAEAMAAFPPNQATDFEAMDLPPGAGWTPKEEGW